MEPFRRFGINVGRGYSKEGTVYSLACVYALLEKNITEYLRPFRLSAAKFNILMVIKHQGKEKGISQIYIGKQLIVTASNITRLLDKLSKEELIERSLKQGDRRVNLIKITPKGSKLLDNVWPGYYAKLQEMGKLLNNDEIRVLSNMLIKWFAQLEKMPL